MKLLASLLILTVLFTACNPEKEYAAEIAEVEQFEVGLDSIMALFKTIDYDSLNYMKKTSSEFEKFIKENYSADTVNQDFANKMTYIKRVRKSLKHLDVNRLSIEKESVALKKQFSDLKNDIKKGRFNAEQIKQYVGEERQAYDQFQLNFKSIYLNQIQQKSNFYFAEPTVSDYINLIKQSSN